jgi:hypothetical protein
MSIFTAVALCATMGCSRGPAETATESPSPETFAGSWRSVTPSLEFIRLTVASKSSEMGVLGARLTFSGVAWEGGGRITGDSVVANMMIAGSATSSGEIVLRALDAQTLRVRVRPSAVSSMSQLDLRLVREN